MFENLGYFSRFLIAMSVVAFAPWLAAKLYNYILSLYKNGEFKKANLDNLIRGEMWRLGGFKNLFKESSKNVSVNFKNRRRNLLTYFEDLLENPNFKQQAKVKSLMPYLKLFDAQYDILPDLEKPYNNLTRCHLSKRDIMGACDVLLTDRKNLFESENLINANDLKEFFLTVCVVRHLLEDAHRKSSTVIKILESNRRFDKSTIYNAIIQLFLIRAGASEKRVFEQSFSQKHFLNQKLNTLNEDQVRKAILSIAKSSSRKPLGIKGVYSLIKSQINRYDYFVKEHVKKKRAEQSKKKSERSQSTNSSSNSRSSSTSYVDPYDKYYDLLGVSPTDSLAKIKKSYHKLAMKHHPDRLQNLSEAGKKAAHDKFTKIKEAFEKVESIKKNRAA